MLNPFSVRGRNLRMHRFWCSTCKMSLLRAYISPPNYLVCPDCGTIANLKPVKLHSKLRLRMERMVKNLRVLREYSLGSKNKNKGPNND